jgi:peptidoglycan/LPS O-acetylase OafA/YrhL
MEWGSGALALACLAAGVLHLVRLVTLRRDVVGEMSHAAMAFGMAAMASPLGDPVPEPFWTAVYVLVAAWFVVLVLRTRSTGGDAVHHVLGSGAMLFMLAADHSAGHGATGGGALLGLVPVTAVALTGYFAWHALRCADRWRRGREPGHCEPGHCEPSGTVLTLRSPVLSACTPQAGAAGRLVAAVAMSAMLLGMI